MVAKQCRNCGGTELETDMSRGDVTCMNCFSIVEENILVSEVGFAEGSGGRMHVQGTFVSHGATGFRGGGHESSDNVKKLGHERIRMTGEQMRIAGNVWRGAQRFFTLAVDAKFNKGRRTEYVVASCLYLQCRYTKSDKMLIDFSERLAINVFELGATYLRLRSALMLKDPMPEVDPAIYNIRFAHRLDFKSEDVNRIAQDATRLIRRFKADWMTQGRRPAGVCGACMVIAARMSGYLRTCEEVAQVVRVSPNTVRKRLMEFAKTQMAAKTVQEWREIPDDDVGEVDEEAEPPIVRENRIKAQMAEARARAEAIRAEGGDEDDEEKDEDGDEGSSGNEEEDEDGRPVRKKRRTGKEKVSDDDAAPLEPAATEDDEQIIGALQAAANDLETYEAADGEKGNAADDDDDDDEDVELPEMERGDFIDDLNRARDDPAEVARQNKIEARAYKRSLKMLDAAEDPEQLQESEFEDDEEEEYAEDEAAEGEQGEGPAAPKKVEFDDWDDEDKMYKYIGETYFKDEINLFKLTDTEVRARVSQWIAGRNPREICGELALVEKARKERERYARRKPETDFSALDEAELEGYYKLEPHELRMRTRVWLSNNGRWLEEDKEKQAKRAAYNKAHNIDPSKPKKQKKKRVVQKGPYNSAREAIETFASTKKFSSRFNYGALTRLGLDEDEKDDDNGLETLDDEYGVGFDEKADYKMDDKVDDDDPANW